jgi:hypothetical protein
MALVAGQVPTSGYRTPDYSGAAAAGGAAGAAPFQVVSGLIDQYQQKKKENQSLNATKKSAEMQIQSAINLVGDSMPGFKEQAQSVLTQMNDPSLSLFEQASIAQNAEGLIRNSFNMMVDREQLEAARARRASMGGGSTASVATPNAGQQIIF